MLFPSESPHRPPALEFRTEEGRRQVAERHTAAHDSLEVEVEAATGLDFLGRHNPRELVARSPHSPSVDSKL